MLNHHLKTYLNWDINAPPIPTRSHLYHLEPVGLGTPFVESLTSYITRLALNHCVTPRNLFISEIVPIIEKNNYHLYQANRNPEEINNGHKYGLDAPACGINGTGIRATILVQATEALTLRNDLRFLTMLTWAEVIPQIGLLRDHRVWCSTCYQEWLQREQIIYEPLVWSLKVVEICSYHHQRLQQRCPHCYKQLPVLASRTRPGYCSSCYQWLGGFPPQEVDDSNTLKESEILWSNYVTSTLGELVAAAPGLLSPLTKENLTKAISICVNQFAFGSASALAHLVGVSQSALYSCYKGKSLLKLSNLLQLFYRLSLSLLQMLTEQVAVLELEQKALMIHRQLQEQPRNPRFPINVEQMRQALEAALVENPPPSLKEMAKRLGHYLYALKYRFPVLYQQIKWRYANYQETLIWQEIQPVLLSALNQEPPPPLKEIVNRLGYKSSQRLYELFPHLCRQISRRYTSYRKACAQKKRERLCQEVRAAAQKIHAEGNKPSISSVSELLTQPGAIRNKYARNALDEIIRELGYEL
ncbi:MAG TPA: hypothetical protein DDW76_01530 [Cyanobacteria bacterium UBA11369]|nr:hypothetical protein [Cyanobacteria bacterium UBA11371]HBE30840.1 hypothetical protein [Cyanobacteria bacterium UBA11368]HBE47514.1 hypothetical protein [Cyanobacteria bacterium UBA11369]